jgi:Ca2+-binding EF-hand superfamily protein
MKREINVIFLCLNRLILEEVHELKEVFKASDEKGILASSTLLSFFAFSIPQKYFDSLVLNR